MIREFKTARLECGFGVFCVSFLARRCRGVSVFRDGKSRKINGNIVPGGVQKVAVGGLLVFHHGLAANLKFDRPRICDSVVSVVVVIVCSIMLTWDPFPQFGV